MSAAENIAVLTLLLVFFVPLGLVWYAYRREESGDLEYGLSYWLGGPLGLLAYREYRKANETDAPDEVRQCPDCFETFTDEPDFCGNCGTEMNPEHDVPATGAERVGQLLFCATCEAELGTEADRCDGCGRAVVE